MRLPGHAKAIPLRLQSVSQPQSTLGWGCKVTSEGIGNMAQMGKLGLEMTPPILPGWGLTHNPRGLQQQVDGVAGQQGHCGQEEAGMRREMSEPRAEP